MNREYINEVVWGGVGCEGWTAPTVVYGFAATCLTGFCDFSETSQSLPGSPMKVEAETSVCMR